MDSLMNKQVIKSIFSLMLFVVIRLTYGQGGLQWEIDQSNPDYKIDVKKVDDVKRSFYEIDHCCPVKDEK